MSRKAASPWSCTTSGTDTAQAKLWLLQKFSCMGLIYDGIQLGLITEPTEGGDSVFADFSAVDTNEADTYFGAEVKQN